MNIREGDPILSSDGKTILAYWAVSIDMPKGANVYHIPVLIGVFAALAYAASPSTMMPPPTAGFASYAVMPDRTYWQVMGESPDGWQHDRRFRPAPEKPSASPAGMVAAYDLVLGDAALVRFVDMQALHHVRGYWAQRAERDRTA